jgi:hypothetical protein
VDYIAGKLAARWPYKPTVAALAARPQGPSGRAAPVLDPASPVVMDRREPPEFWSLLAEWDDRKGSGSRYIQALVSSLDARRAAAPVTYTVVLRHEGENGWEAAEPLAQLPPPPPLATSRDGTETEVYAYGPGEYVAARDVYAGGYEPYGSSR